MKLVNSFDNLFENFHPHFKSTESFGRARSLAYCSVFTYGRRTISRLICSKNEQHNDWSADYKFFSLREWNANDLFLEILKECDEHSYWPDGDVLVALDETIRKKTGKKIPGVATLRDPMSLPYHVNLSPGLRYLQAACIITPENKLEYKRAIPIFFQEAAPAKKPKKNASDSEKEHYKKEQKAKRITVQGHEATLKIRTQVDQLPEGQSRRLFITADGSFANRNFLRDLPDTITPIVRVRKDLKFFKPAADVGTPGKGRRRIYGERLPTPEEFRKDDSQPYQKARVFAAGKYHFDALAAVGFACTCVLASSVLADTKSKIENTGLWIQCGSARGSLGSTGKNGKREKPRLVIDRLRIGDGASRLGAGFASAHELEMMLKLPRNRANDVPRAVLCSTNGDLLRGNLLSMNRDEVSFKSK